MGIPMADNLHAPTVSSGSTSGGVPRDLSKLSMGDLMKHKEGIEEELSALSSVLSSHGVNMNTALTTFDGFPRDDIDVAQIRTIRAQIIRLRYDHKQVMSQVEKGIHSHFAGLQSTRSNETSTSNIIGSAARPSGPTSSTAATGVLTPFAKVNSVMSGSPAGQAGLQAGDTIRSFGSVNWLNHERLSKVAEVVQQNEGRTIIVKISRNGATPANPANLDLELVPRRDWGGRGLLGCHLLPL
ncbi:putative 26S proteasome non-ATPase regulatory subunit Nas2 [Aspergillus undulatus]|uniref:putative 26S proteasome non-ATPase regulatory subunit Nas2 n=1 Tax=Aspergillus undulatus TaxID=1810928 RepID=UPI003CCD2167